MAKFVVDPGLQEKLKAPLEFCDPMGQTLGYFLTPDEFERLRQVEEELRRRDYEWAVADVSDEELDAALAEGGEYTHEEVMEHIRQLEAQERSKPS